MNPSLRGYNPTRYSIHLIYIAKIQHLSESQNKNRKKFHYGCKKHRKTG
nr:MAG TPA: hypothetical protein [Caudoviricetes sp.]